MQLHAALIRAAMWGVTHLQAAQHGTEQTRKLDLCAPAQHLTGAAFRAVSRCLAVSVSCRISTRVCSSVMQDAVQLGQVLLGRSGLDLAANQRRHRW